MKIGALIGVVAVLVFGGAGAPSTATAAGPIACEQLARVSLTNAAVISAESVPAGGFTLPVAGNASAADMFKTLPAFCRVTARLTPTPDSDIRIEVWLPQSGWNRKLQAAGNGGLGGTIPYPALAAAVTAGYAAAGTDTGHVGGNADFVAGHPEKLVDFAYRAIHEMTVAAKALRGGALRCAPGAVLLQLVLDREDGRRSSKRSATRRISTASSPATRRGIRCASTPRGSP